MVEAVKIHAKGVVQGVGFRPFVYRLAKHNLIFGWVLNAKDGVLIHAEGEGQNLSEFVNELHTNPPAAAQVKELELDYVPLENFTTFEIRTSHDGAMKMQGEAKQNTLVSADLATCDACLTELFNPCDHRFRYPFINCTNCGPRFTIIDKLPYDRPSTSMKHFDMCASCKDEYENPADRRFHAQPNACFDCGPQLSFFMPAKDGWHKAYATCQKDSDAILKTCARMLAAGGIVAVKGLGGFHLVCDGSNEEAITKLRQRKRRLHKPFAVMVANTNDASCACHINDAEKQQLEAPARPIVLLKKRKGIKLAAGLADKLAELGVMLPTTPVQHLLLHDFAQELQSGAFLQDDKSKGEYKKDDNTNKQANKNDTLPPMLVMTSGNVNGQPIVIDDACALEQFQGVADAILGNNREILTRFDDSVLRIISVGANENAVQFIRRARGFAPLPIQISATVKNEEEHSQGFNNTTANRKPFFTTGAQQKATFALCVPNSDTTNEYSAFISQHIGNVENAEVFDAWLESKCRFEQLFSAKPEKLCCDCHPEYTTTKWAQEQKQAGFHVDQVQHHHAHIASVLGENNIDETVCGIAFDGTGFGVDGKIWGGEVLFANKGAFERFANFTYVPMPGGAACIKNPLRMAYGVLYAFDLLEHPAAARVLKKLGNSASVCNQMIENNINTPYTSSVGRLFDAASAILGVCDAPSYEGQPSIELEALLHEGIKNNTDSKEIEPYTIDIVKNSATKNSTAQDTSVVLLDAAKAFSQLLDDVLANVAGSTIALKFHKVFVEACVNTALLVPYVYGLDVKTVALSGGVFANRYIIEQTTKQLQQAGFNVALNKDLPPNDGCIAFGQAVVCAQA